MISDAGMVVSAIPITISDSGNVASKGFPANSLPMIPPSVTIRMLPETNTIWAKNRMMTLRRRMSRIKLNNQPL